MNKILYKNISEKINLFKQISNKTESDYNAFRKYLEKITGVIFENEDIDKLLKDDNIIIGDIDFKDIFKNKNNSLIYDNFISNKNEIENDFSENEELKTIVSDLVSWQKSELFLYLDTYFKNFFEVDFNNGIYSEYLTLKDNKIIFKNNSNEFKAKFYNKVINNINKNSLTLQKVKGIRYEINHANNMFNGQDIIYSNGFIYIDKKEYSAAQLIGDKIKLKNGKEFSIKSAKKESGTFTVFKNTISLDRKVSSAKAGKSDLLMFNEHNGQLLASDVTISKDSKIEGSSQLRHYIDNIVLTQIDIKGKRLQEYIKEGLDSNSFKSLLSENLDLIDNIDKVDHTLKIIYLLKKLNIPMSNFEKINKINVNGIEIKNIEEILTIKNIDSLIINDKDINELKLSDRMINELKIKTEDTLKYTYRFNNFNSLLDNVYFITSSMGISSKISLSTMDISSFKEFYKSISKEVVSDGIVNNIEGEDVVNVLEFIENILKGNTDIKKLEEHLKQIKNKENFSSVFLAITNDIINKGLFNLSTEKIYEIKNIFQKIEGVFDNNTELSIYKLESFTNKSTEDLVKLALSDEETFEDNVFYLNLDQEDEEDFRDYLNKYKNSSSENRKERLLRSLTDLLSNKKEELKEILLNYSSNEVIESDYAKKQRKLSEEEYLISNIKQEELYEEGFSVIEKNIFNIMKAIKRKDIYLYDMEFYTEDYLNKIYDNAIKIKEIKIEKDNNKRKELNLNELSTLDKKKEIKEYLKNKYRKISNIITDKYIEDLITTTFNESVDKAFNEIILGSEFKLNEYTLNGAKEIGEDILNDLLSGKEVVFFVDNDADGSSAYALLHNLQISIEKDINMKIFYTKDTKTVRGINYEQVKTLKEQNKIGDNPHIVTADNGTSNINQFDDIKKLFGENFKMTITDHHPFDKEEMFEFYKEREWLKLLNGRYDLTGKEIQKNKFNISGAATIGTALHNSLYDSERLNAYKETNERIMDISNYFDLVSTEETELDSETTILQKMSTEINCIQTFEKLENSDIYLSEDHRRKIQTLKSLANVYLDSFKDNDLVDITEKILNLNVNDSQEENLFDRVTYLRFMYIFLYAKTDKTKEEEILFQNLKELMSSFKALEKEIIQEVREDYLNSDNDIKENIYKNISVDNGEIQIFKNNGMGNKFYRKVFPVSNKGFLINGSIEDNMFSGSFRGNEFSFEEIFGEQLGDNLIMKGQPLASGFKVIFPEGVDKDKYLKNILEKASKKIEELKANKKQEETPIVSLEDLSEIDKLEQDLKSTRNIKNLKRIYYIPISELSAYAVSKDVKNISIDNIKGKEDFEYKRMQLSFTNGINLIIKDSDLQNLKEDSFLKVKVVSDKLFFSEGVEDSISEELSPKTENKRESITDYQMKEHSKNYNKDNNFTVDISVEDFIRRNNLNGLSETEIIDYFEDIKNLMDSTNTDTKVILDIEGLGFGKKTKMINFGSYNIEKCEDCKYGVKISNTSIIIDINSVLSGSIQELTGFKTKDLKDYGITEEEVDKILVNLFGGDKKVLYQAHNIAYDYNGIRANLPKFGELMKNSLKLDSAIYSRGLALANDSNVSYSKISINDFDNNIELGNFYDYGNNSVSSFLKDSIIGSKFKNKADNIELSWELLNGTKTLKISGLEHDLYYSENEIDSFLKKKKIKMPIKYSVAEILKQSYIKIVRENILNKVTNKSGNYQSLMKDLLLKKLPEHKKFIKNIKDFEDIERSNNVLREEFIFNFLEKNNILLDFDEDFNYNELIKLLKRYRRTDIEDNEKEKIDKFIISFEKYDSELKKDFNSFKRDLEKEKIIIDNISINLDILFTNSVDLKKILNNYNEDKTIEDNLLEIMDNVSLNNKDIEVFLKNIIEVDKKYEKGELENFNINPELLKVGLSFHKNFRELHNNVESNFSDVSYEVIIMLLSKKKFDLYYNKSFTRYIEKAIIRTEQNMSSLNTTFKHSYDNGFTARQEIDRGEKESSNTAIIKSKELSTKEIVVKSDNNIELVSKDFNNLVDLVDNKVSLDKIENSIPYIAKSLFKKLEKDQDVINPLEIEVKDIDFKNIDMLNRIFNSIIEDLDYTVDLLEARILNSNNKSEIERDVKTIKQIKDLKFYFNSKEKINEIKEDLNSRLDSYKEFAILKTNTKVLKKHFSFIIKILGGNYTNIEEIRKESRKFFQRNKLNINSLRENQKEDIKEILIDFINKISILEDNVFKNLLISLYSNENIFEYNKKEEVKEKFTTGIEDKLVKISLFQKSLPEQNIFYEIQRSLNNNEELEINKNKEEVQENKSNKRQGKKI